MSQKTPVPDAPAAADCASPFDTLLSQAPPAARPPKRADGIAIGRLQALAADGQAQVSLPGFGRDSVAAPSLVPLEPCHIGQAVALGFEGADPARPIVLGVLLKAPAEARPVEAAVDGERLVITAEREIELRCGEAALILQADGAILLRGRHITSHASATQRIRGGSVSIN